MKFYKFYPDINNEYFKQIYDDVIGYMLDKTAMKLSELKAMDFNKLYDLFVQTQRDNIMKKTPDEHFESAAYFIEKMRDKTAFERFAKKFDDFHRFFPEKVFKLISASALIDYMITYNTFESASYRKFNQEDKLGIDGNFYNLIKHYIECGGDSEFSEFYFRKFSVDTNAMYENLPEKPKKGIAYTKFGKPLRKAYYIHSIPTKNNIISLYSNAKNYFGSMVSAVRKQVSTKFEESSWRNKQDQILESFNSNEIALADQLENFDVDFFKDQLKLYVQNVILRSRDGAGVKPNSDSEECYSVVRDYVLTSLGEDVGLKITPTQNIVKELASSMMPNV